MIYLDNGATSFYKPPQVERAMVRALHTCASPGRGGYRQSMDAAKRVFSCRQLAGELFDCQPEQVVFTTNCTHGLNIAIGSLIKPGDRVVISGFKHNAVTRPLYALGAKITVVGRKLFCHDTLLSEFEQALKTGTDAAVFTHVSNVFGYILPVEEMAVLCKRYGVPFIIDAAQSAGTLPVKLAQLGADFIAMPGHKGLLGPQGTGILLCADTARPILYGGTGSDSMSREMPSELPERLEAGTVNVPGIAGLGAGLAYLKHTGIEGIQRRKYKETEYCIQRLWDMGIKVYSGPHQCGTLSFVPDADCELVAERLAKRGIAVRGGLHCAPLAHESAGTLETGTVRVSFGHDANRQQTEAFLREMQRIMKKI